MIFLIRHGEIECKGKERFIGQTDVPLNENGIQQAMSWQKVFSEKILERIYCSNLSRTRLTAQIICGKQSLKICEMPALREINLGELENYSFRDVYEKFPEKWRNRGEDIFFYRPAMGESFSDLYNRVIPVFEKIASNAKNDILIVSHAGVNRVILCHVLGIPPENLFRIKQDYACLNKIDCRKKPYQVDVMNFKLTDDI
ncbi:MAG: alpha-ribazole phosphatase [Proteobacteria bacterium]|nr:alpha-ribazole phosphatase [Pseudomonadota bacterium]